MKIDFVAFISVGLLIGALCPFFLFIWGLFEGFGCLVVGEYTLGCFVACNGLILSFRGYLGVLLGLVFRYLSFLGLFLQILVVFGVLEFVGWGEF